MVQYSHKGQILPLTNQMIPIDKQTTFHASYDYHLNGFNQGDLVYPAMPQSSSYFNGSSKIWLTRTIQDDFTIEAWIKTTSVGAGAAHYTSLPILHSESSGFHPDFGFGITSGGKLIFGNGGSSDVSAASATSVNDGKWHHVAVTRSLSTGLISLYIDGIADGTATGNAVSLTYNPNMYIGYGEDGAGYFTGNIAEVRTWNRVLSANEISIYKDKQLTGSETGLVGYWKLTEKESMVSFDGCGLHDGVWTGTHIYDGNANTIATLQKNRGKFGGAVLIEPDTTNLYTSQSAFTPSSVTATFNSGTNEWTMTVANGSTASWRGIYYNKSDAIISPGDWVTMSFEVYANDIVPMYVDVNNYPITTSTGTNDNDVTSSRIFRTGNTAIGQWTKMSATYTISSSATQNFYDGCQIVFNNGWVPTKDITIRIRNIQLEKRDYPTSFVNGSRPLGKLWYPFSLFNQSAWTISCWFNIPWMHRSDAKPPNTGIQGNWYHPIIEIAPPVKSTNTSGYTGFALIAGPQPSGYNRTIRIRYATSTSSNTDQAGVTAIQDNTWYHAVVTYDGANINLYINGTLEKTAPIPSIQYDNNCVVMIGGGYYGKAFINIDEVRIESRAISADEVSAWAASGLHYNYLDYSYYVD